MTSEVLKYSYKDFDLTGDLKDAAGTLLGKYVFLPTKKYQAQLDALCDSWIEQSKKDPDFFITRDYETTALIPQRGDLVLSCVSWDGNNSVVFVPANFDLTKYKEALRTVPINNQDNKFDIKWDLVSLKTKPKLFHCTRYGSQVLYCGHLIDGQFNLGYLAEHILDLKMEKETRKEFPEMVPIKVGDETYFQSPDGLIYLQDYHIMYGARDAVITHRLAIVERELLKKRNLLKLFDEIEIPTIEHFSEEETKGLKIDLEELNNQINEGTDDLVLKTQELEELFRSKLDLPKILQDKKGNPDKFNPNSVHQLRKLFQNLKLSPKSMKATDLETLEHEIYDSDPNLAKIVQLTRSVRETSSYLSKFPKAFEKNAALSDTGDRIYYSINVCLAATGRLSCKDPNLMAIQEEGRKVFIPDDPEYVFTPADYGQFEFRAIAGLSGEKKLLDAFNKRAELYPEVEAIGIKNGFDELEMFLETYEKGSVTGLVYADEDLIKEFLNQDIHRVNASLIFGGSPSDIQKAQRRAAKAQPLWSKVLTPSGWVSMGDLKVGDVVCTPCGTTSKILEVHPFTEKDIYEIKLSTGQTTYACEDHLWAVHTYEGEKKVKKTVTTKWIQENLKRNGIHRTRESNVFLKTIKAPELNDVAVPLSPYVLGCFLGNGHVTKAGYCTVTSSDLDLVEKIKLELDAGLTISRCGGQPSDRTPTYRITRPKEVGMVNSDSLYKRLKSIGLENSRSRTKFVPDIYKNNSEQVRLTVLQGLLDTAGTVCKRSGRISFTSVSKQLAEDVQYLLRSFGTAPKMNEYQVNEYQGVYNGKPFTYYSVGCMGIEGYDFFRLSRKKKLVKKIPQEKHISIASVTKLERKEKVQCIRIDHPNHLYITDDFIPTHNTFGYSLLYGAGIRKVRASLISDGFVYTIQDIKDLAKRFEDNAPDMFAYIRDVRKQVLDPGYIETTLGRKKYFKLVPKWYSNYVQKLESAKRQAVNAKQQSANADALKLSIVRLRSEVIPHFIDKYPLTRIPLSIHDELLSQVHRSTVNEYLAEKKRIMIECGGASIGYTCPIEVSVKIAERWIK